MTKRKAPIALKFAAIVALLFGLATILSGGRALFDDSAALGDVVPFILWFNFGAGFAYVVAGICIFQNRNWGRSLSALIVLATLLVFGAFGVFIWNGGAYEARTVGAMLVRSLIWIVIAVISYRPVYRR